jgi:D-aminopeptidase
LPLLFSAGDQVLGAQLGPAIPYVQTKHSSGRGEASSFSVEQVERAFREVVRAAPAPLPQVASAPLQLRFQTIAEAEAAARAGGTRRGPTILEVSAKHTFQAQYDEALTLIDAAEPALLARIKGAPGTVGFLRNAARLLLEPWEG